MEYDAVLFDNDGVLTTLTDRAELRAAVRDAFDTVGVSDPAEEDIDSLLGTTVPTLNSIAKRYGVDPGTLWHHRDEYAADRQIDAIERGDKRLYDDAATINRLDAAAGIVSNNQHRTVEFIASHYGLSWADVVYGREQTPDGIRRKKPNTYYLERAMSDLGLTPPADRVLYVGDSPKDITAAHRAGADAAFIRRPHRIGESLPAEPAYEVQHLDELVETLNGN